MNRKGFTLIELLAVIVILAIIALIATPAVINIIEDSRKSAVEESGRNIARAAETYYMQGVMKGETPSTIDLTTDTLNYNGEKPEKGILSYDETGRAYIKMYMNGYCVVVDVDNSAKAEKKDKDDCKLNMVLLSIDAKGGEVSEVSREYDSGDTIGELPIPTREGYTFKGWILSNGTSVTSETVITENMTINASWEANTYEVTLSDGDDTTTDIVIDVTYDSVYAEMPEPTKEGYIFFDGWKLEDGTDVTSETIVKVAGNHTIYAQWSNVAPNGTPFLYDPVNNTKCDTSIGSAIGTKDGCMKWYAFLDNENSETVNLILGHNTIGWTIPADILAQLNNSIVNWNVDVKSTARLISAEEINQIAPTASSMVWDINDTTIKYYFHTGTQNLYEGAAGTNKYAWLFDNTMDCTTYGCNTVANTWGYWTSSYAPNDYIWVVVFGGNLYADTYPPSGYGIRPVIEVSKEVFEKTNLG